MIAKVVIEFDTTTGKYEIEFKNISDPGVGIERDKLHKIIQRILADFNNTLAPVSELKNKKCD